MATLQDLKDGEPASIPQYDFVTSSRKSEPTSVESADVILFDGILAFYSAGGFSCDTRTHTYSIDFEMPWTP